MNKYADVHHIMADKLLTQEKLDEISKLVKELEGVKYTPEDLAKIAEKAGIKHQLVEFPRSNEVMVFWYQEMFKENLIDLISGWLLTDEKQINKARLKRERRYKRNLAIA